MHHLALAVGDPHAKIPYRHVKPCNVVGLPPGVTFTHPSSMPQDHLQQVYSNIDALKFVGKHNYVQLLSMDYISVEGREGGK